MTSAGTTRKDNAAQQALCKCVAAIHSSATMTPVIIYNAFGPLCVKKSIATPNQWEKILCGGGFKIGIVKRYLYRETK